jgi:protein-S-isoprenylcysteine O-methyltransferase Ste14
VVSAARLVATGLYLLLWPALLLLIGGDWRWPQGWAFGTWFVAMSTHVIVWLYVKDPALLAERYRRPGTGGQSRRDLIIVYVLGLDFLAWYVLMPLDHRLHLSPPMPLTVNLWGGVVLAVAWFFFFRAFHDNSFVSPLVRIQSERKQTVVSTGVYGVVRHPMYLGALLMFFGAPLVTGGLTALVLALAMVAILVKRIGLEEALLVKELEGYEEYRRRVRWRLVPYLW